jgi:tetratricopeptide (TPR) repeat protein
MRGGRHEPERAVAALALAAALAGPFVAACGGDTPTPPDVALVADVLDAEGRASLRAATEAVLGAPDDAARWRTLGRRYELLDLPAQAESAYAGALRLEPDDARTEYRAAVTARAAGEVERASERMARVVTLDPTYGPAWRRAGLWRLEDGDVAGAREAFERAAPLLEGRADVPLCMARAALLADDVDLALRHARTAADRAPDDPYVRLVLGTALRRAGLLDEAEPHLAAGQGATPAFEDPWSAELQADAAQDDALAERGRALEAERRWAEAADVYTELLARRPGDDGVSLRLGVALLQSGRADDAIALYDRVLERTPGNYEVAVARASALQTAKRDGEAFRAADGLIERWPDRLPAYLVRGELRRKQADLEGAREDFERAVALAPSDVRGPLFLGRVLLQSERYEEATEVLVRGLDAPGARPPLPYFSLLLRAQARLGLPPEALARTLERARAIHGDAADTLVRRDR